MKVVLATKNPGKLRELQDLADGLKGVEFVLAPPHFDPVEDGDTFVTNAIIKAKAAALETKLHSLSDDSGIEVYALGGAPGIYSARYCEGSDADRRHKLVRELAKSGSEDRRGAFVCAMAFCAPSGEVLQTVECRWEGLVIDAERGSNGFGYDPIFYLEEVKMTSAEMTSAEKNKVSHRAQAWFAMRQHIEQTSKQTEQNMRT